MQNFNIPPHNNAHRGVGCACRVDKSTTINIADTYTPFPSKESYLRETKMKISAGRLQTHVGGLRHGTREGKGKMEKFETESAAILSLSERKVCRVDV